MSKITQVLARTLVPKKKTGVQPGTETEPIQVSSSVLKFIIFRPKLLWDLWDSNLSAFCTMLLPTEM